MASANRWLLVVGVLVLRPVLAPASAADDSFNQGLQAIKEKDYDGAITHLTEAIRLDPKKADAYFWRASAFGHLKQYAKAVADYTETIRLDPQNARAFFFRGEAQGHQNAPDQAIADYTEAIGLGLTIPGTSSPAAWPTRTRRNTTKPSGTTPRPSAATLSFELAYLYRGRAYADKGQLDKAIAEYTQVIRLKPKFAPPYFARGLAHLIKNDPDRAIGDFTEAIRLDPQSLSPTPCAAVPTGARPITTGPSPILPRRSVSIPRAGIITSGARRISP